MIHHPTEARGHAGVRVVCSCGWKSGLYPPRARLRALEAWHRHQAFQASVEPWRAAQGVPEPRPCRGQAGGNAAARASADLASAGAVAARAAAAAR